MRILNYNIESVVNFDEVSIEEFLVICESAIENITKDKHIQFKLKSVLHELIINSIEHGYKKTSGIVGFMLKSTNNSYVIEITDEGVGLESGAKGLQKDYSNLDNLNARGWGLNLISKLSSGQIHICRNIPKGTKVSVSINK